MGVHNLIIYEAFPPPIEVFLSSEPPILNYIKKADNNFIISLLTVLRLGTGLMENMIFIFRCYRMPSQCPVKNGTEMV
jgi:hypothetical protein